MGESWNRKARTDHRKAFPRVGLSRAFDTNHLCLTHDRDRASCTLWSRKKDLQFHGNVDRRTTRRVDESPVHADVSRDSLALQEPTVCLFPPEDNRSDQPVASVASLFHVFEGSARADATGLPCSGNPWHAARPYGPSFFLTRSKQSFRKQNIRLRDIAP